MNTARLILCLICISYSASSTITFADGTPVQSESDLVVDGAVGMHICGEDYFHIEDVYKDTPAWNAGIRKGDLLISVDGVLVQGKSVKQICDMIRGKTGTKVTIEVEQSVTHTRKTFEITRSIIHIHSTP